MSDIYFPSFNGRRLTFNGWGGCLSFEQENTIPITLSAIGGWLSAAATKPDQTIEVLTLTNETLSTAFPAGTTINMLASGSQGTNTASYATAFDGSVQTTANLNLPVDGSMAAGNRLTGYMEVVNPTGIGVKTVQTVKYNCNGYGSTNYPCSMSFSSQYGSYGYRQSGFVPVGGVITETGSCTSGLTYSLHNLDGMSTTSCTWNHANVGSNVTAKGTVTGVNSDELITIGNANGRDKNITAYCHSLTSNNQANCSDYQPMMFVQSVTSNCHPNNVLNGSTYDSTVSYFFKTTTTAELRWGNGSNGWTNYNADSTPRPLVSANLAAKLMTWSANLTIKNITAGVASPTYWIWGYSTSRSQLNKSTMSRGGSLNKIYIGTTGTKMPFMCENGSTKPMNHSAYMTITGRYR